MVIVVRILLAQRKYPLIVINSFGVLTELEVVPSQLSQMVDRVVHVVVIGILAIALKAHLLCCLP
jgi:hypothetical protein